MKLYKVGEWLLRLSVSTAALCIASGMLADVASGGFTFGAGAVVGSIVGGVIGGSMILIGAGLIAYDSWRSSRPHPSNRVPNRGEENRSQVRQQRTNDYRPEPSRKHSQNTGVINSSQPSKSTDVMKSQPSKSCWSSFKSYLCFFDNVDKAAKDFSENTTKKISHRFDSREYKRTEYRR